MICILLDSLEFEAYHELVGETSLNIESAITCELNKHLKPSLFDKRVGQGKTSQRDAEYAVSEQMNENPLSENPMCLELSEVSRLW